MNRFSALRVTPSGEYSLPHVSSCQDYGQSRWEKKLLYFTIWLLSIPLSSRLVIGVNLVGLIHPGPEWKKLKKKI